MPSIAALALLSALLTGHGDDARWVDARDSFAALSSFLVRVDLHAKPEELAGVSADGLKAQIERTLRARGITVASMLGDDPHGLGFLNLDVHVLAAGKGTSVAWTLHASQVVQVHGGAYTLGGTWEVGDLLHGARDRITSRVRDSLQPAVNEFCDDYLRNRGAPAPQAPPARAPEKQQPGADL